MPRNKYRFIHVTGNEDLERQLAEQREAKAKSSVQAAKAIQEAEAKRQQRRQRNLSKGVRPDE